MKEAPAELPDGRGLRVAVLRARFNRGIVDGLSEGAEAALTEMRVAHVLVAEVPGSFELPLAAKAAAASGRFDAVVALGAVIRGDTYHFDVVANESARGVMDVMLEFGVPVANGILTTDDERQAAARLEKGAEAVRVAVEMARLKSQLHEAR